MQNLIQLFLRKWEAKEPFKKIENLDWNVYFGYMSEI